MIRSVVKKGDERLYAVSTNVDDIQSVAEVIRDLHDTLTGVQQLYNFMRGSGIAAPQIGVNVRISVVEFDKVRYTLINPEIIEHSVENVIIREGCLSFFSERGYIPRHSFVRVRYTDENGDEQTVEATDNFASVLQHEIDHLDGKLYDFHLPTGAVLEPHLEMPFIP